MTIPYFDAHCDTVTKFHALRRNRDHLDLERLGAYAPAAQVLGLWAPPGMDNPLTLERLLRTAERQLQKNTDIAALCRSMDEADAAAAAGKTAIFLGVEGSSLLGGTVAGLLSSYRRGVRMVTLCWNRDNRVCGAARGESGGGLTADGRRFVDSCWQLGVAVDLSHAAERTFWDVLRGARRPVLCSHSNARAVCDNTRNLTDAQITAIVHNEGCIGLNLCADFLGRSRDMDAILAHIDHFLCLDARENLCLGTDFDGVEQLPAGIAGVQDMAALYEAMLRHRFSESLVRDVFYNNLARFLRDAL